MTIYRCDKCSKEDGEDYPPCVFINTVDGAQIPNTCAYNEAWYHKELKAEWVQIDEMPEDVKL